MIEVLWEERRCIVFERDLTERLKKKQNQNPNDDDPPCDRATATSRMLKKADTGKNACATSAQTIDSRRGTAIPGCVSRLRWAFFRILLDEPIHPVQFDSR